MLYEAQEADSQAWLNRDANQIIHEAREENSISVESVHTIDAEGGSCSSD